MQANGISRNPLSPVVIAEPPPSITNCMDLVAVVGAKCSGSMEASTYMPESKELSVIVVALPELVTPPVRLALVVTVPAVSPAAVPVTLVITPLAGVPNTGATNIVPVTNVAMPEVSAIVAHNEPSFADSVPVSTSVAPMILAVAMVIFSLKVLAPVKV